MFLTTSYLKDESFSLMVILAGSLFIACGGSASIESIEESPEIIEEVAQPVEEPSQPAPLVDLKSIAGKGPDEVAAVLGVPNSQSSTKAGSKNYPKHFYHDGTVEVVFVNGVSEWISVFGTERLSFHRNSLADLGLPVTGASFVNPRGFMRWDNHAGLKEVSFFPNGSGGIRYIYICVRTCP